jgi:hypothetical protein
MPIGKQFPLYLMTNVGILSEDFDEEVEILRHHHPPPATPAVEKQSPFWKLQVRNSLTCVSELISLSTSSYLLVTTMWSECYKNVIVTVWGPRKRIFSGLCSFYLFFFHAKNLNFLLFIWIFFEICNEWWWKIHYFTLQLLCRAP